MIILGIDPGLATTGYGVIESQGSKIKLIDFGIITTPSDKSLPERLEMIASTFKTLLSKHTVDEVAIEELFFNTNAKTAMAVAQARGIYLLISQASRIPIASYSPPQIKSGISGYGQASKSQVQFMVKKLLNLETTPKPDDAADALAIAICHNNMRSSKNTIKEALKQTN
jgi:crossover junction endodeoxyribonuclease RuvC